MYKKKSRRLLISLLFLPFLVGCALFPPKVDYNDDPEDYEGDDPLIGKPITEIIRENGIQEGETLSFNVTEDAYVQDGNSNANDCANNNYGASTEIEAKAVSSNGKLGRLTYLKFNLSGIKASGIYKVSFNINCKSTQTSQPTSIGLYEVSNNSWTESGITFANQPTYGSLVAEARDAAKGLVSIDITSYIRARASRTNKTFSFALVNTSSPSCRITFESKEASGIAPFIKVRYSELSFSTNVKISAGKANPWEYAVRMVNSWNKHKVAINSQNPEQNSTIPDVISSEYSRRVDAAKANQTGGNSEHDTTQYTSYPTRTVSTINGYTYNSSEKEHYDIYGGLIGTLSFTPTGYFYVTQNNGRYWIVDPLGNPFYRVAVNALSTGDTTCHQSILNQYGSDQAWAREETNFLKNSLGYNSAGAWSTTDVLLTAEQPLSQSPIIYFASEYGKEIGVNNTTGGSTTFVNNAMPVFDPGFENFSDRRANTIVKPYADEENILGWFLDNELEAGGNMILNFMNLDPQNELNAYSYATVWTFLYNRLNKFDIDNADITTELKNEFRAMVYDRYFDVTTTAVKKYDTNHMIIGCRYLRTIFNDEWCMKVAGYYNDIISFNMYNIWTPSDGSNDDSFVNMHNWTNTPFIVTEWYAKGMDACTEESQLTNLSGAGWTVRTQTDRGYFYHNYALRLLECKYCAGFDYFKLWDNNPFLEGADTSNTNSNKGIYNIYHQPYTALTNAMAELNLNKYSLINFFDARNA